MYTAWAGLRHVTTGLVLLLLFLISESEGHGHGRGSEGIEQVQGVGLVLGCGRDIDVVHGAIWSLVEHVGLGI